jgi:hypothetical protein
MFPGGIVEVCGFDWCKDKPIRVGVSSVTAKILCKRHNSDLSPIDSAGKCAFDVFRQIVELAVTRAKLKPHAWKIKKYTINGRSLERWCLKTLINLCCDRGHPIGRDSSADGRPSDRLVRIAYGQEAFQKKAGLYWVTCPGTQFSSDEKVEFMPLFKNNLNVEAGIFTFRGWMLMIFLEEEGPPEPLTGIFMNAVHLGEANLSFHGDRLNMNVGKYASHRLLLEW